MSSKKRKIQISLSTKFSIYNFLVAIVPVFLAICITLTFIFSLIHMIYSSDENKGNVQISNSRDIVTVYFCQFNIRVIENSFRRSDDMNKTTFLASSAYKRLESYGFSLLVTFDDSVVYISDNCDEEYFIDSDIYHGGNTGGVVFLSDSKMHICDVTYSKGGRPIRVTLKHTGIPGEEKTSVALNMVHLKNTGFIMILFLVILISVVLDMTLVRRLTASVMIPLKNLGEAADRIKCGDLDKPVDIDSSTQELNDLGKTFDEMRIQFKKSVEEKKEYDRIRQHTYSDLNHDIRTCVTTIKGYAQGLIDGIANTLEKQDRYINAILYSTESLEKLVDALSEITRLETNTVAFSFKERDMYSLFTNWYAESSPSLEARGIRIIMTYNCEKRVFCNIDTFQFERIVDNLLSNCVKYKKPCMDHINVTITSGISSDGMFLITYKDNGIGVSHEDAQKIFDPFFRADEARSNVQSGNGFGLSIVKQIILKHSGTITAGGEKNEGLILTMKLPISRTEDL